MNIPFRYVAICIILQLLLLASCREDTSEEGSEQNKPVPTATVNEAVVMADLEEFVRETGSNATAAELASDLQEFSVRKDRSQAEYRPGKTYVASFNDETAREEFISTAFSTTGMQRYRQVVELSYPDSVVRETIDMYSDGSSLRAVMSKNMTAVENGGLPGLAVSYSDYDKPESLNMVLQQMNKIDW